MLDRNTIVNMIGQLPTNTLLDMLKVAGINLADSDQILEQAQVEQEQGIEPWNAVKMDPMAKDRGPIHSPESYLKELEAQPGPNRPMAEDEIDYLNQGENPFMSQARQGGNFASG